MQRFLLILVLLISYSLAVNANPLPVNEVFKLSANYTAEQLQLKLAVSPGYYLYKDKIRLSLLNPADAQLAKPQLPKGIIKQHQILGTFEAYQQTISLNIPLNNLTNTTIALNYQGCAESGFCYPPQTRYITLADKQISILNPEDTSFNHEQDAITQLLNSHNYLWILLGFLGFGLLLAFTPCVFPMLPILAGIIAGQGQQLTTRKAFQLSLSYVLAMASTYAIAGIAAAYAGTYIQGALQKPWLIVTFSSIFVLLALSLFGFYELQLPSAWQQKLTQLSNKQQSGRYISVALMGCLSTLIVSPCVSAPLIGALAYIGQTGDLMLGGIALFSLGLGMGIPLLIIGTSTGKLLPKAGAWMETIKQIFGFMLLGLAIWLLSRIIASSLSLLLWTGLCLGASIYLGAFRFKKSSKYQRLNQLLGVTSFSIAILLAGKLLLTVINPNLNLSYFSPINTAAQPLVFQIIHNQAELNTAIQQAQSAKQTILLDFYAEWCISCKAIEKNVLTEPKLQQRLHNFVRLKVDVTKMNQEQKQLMQNLGVVAPPTFLFFKQGQEMKQHRLVGEVNSLEFNRVLKRVNNQP